MILLAGNVFPPCSPSNTANAEYITTTDGVEVLAMLTSGTCDKTVLGEGLSTWSALEVLELWRSVDQTLPILLVSGNSDWTGIRRGVLGVDDRCAGIGGCIPSVN